MVLQIRVCIDVDDLEKAITFYTRAFGLRQGRRFDKYWAELLGATSAIDLLQERPGSAASPGSSAMRDFSRHWTPVHLDFLVPDIDAAVLRAVDAGAKLERPIADRVYGRLANLADPFGHGICLLQMNDRGYEALIDSR